MRSEYTRSGQGFVAGSLIGTLGGLLGLGDGATPLVPEGILRWIAGLIAGLGIGMVAALPEVAGGELPIPTMLLGIILLVSAFKTFQHLH